MKLIFSSFLVFIALNLGAQSFSSDLTNLNPGSNDSALSSQTSSSMGSQSTPDETNVSPTKLVKPEDKKENQENKKGSQESKKENQVFPIEELYSKVYGKPLTEFGYDITLPLRTPLAGTVLPSYVLGPGDVLTLYVWGDPVDLGALKPLTPLKVDATGGVFYPPVGFLPVAGLTLGDLQNTLKAEMARKFKHFYLSLTVSQMRQFSVLVTGFVNRPGMIPITSGYDLLSVLQAAGGVSKNGSLRSIVWTSATGQTRMIDLYQMLLKGKPLNIRISEGDSFYVPPIGTTVGVVGSVLRPAIYEALPGETIADAIKMAGGTTADSADGKYRITHFQQGKAFVSEGSMKDEGFSQQTVKNNILLDLFPSSLEIKNGVNTEGPLYNAGWFSLSKSDSLFKVLEKLEYKKETDMHHAVILRTSALNSQAFNFDPQEVLSKKIDFTLKPGDILRFFQNENASEVIVFGDVQSPQVVSYRKSLTLEQTLSSVVFKEDSRNLMAQIFPPKGKRVVVFLRDYLTVLNPKEIQIEAGSRIEITPIPHDMPNQEVVVTGAVAKPGAIPFREGESISQILQSVGGLTKNAFLKGAVLIRPSITAAQEQQTNKVTMALTLQINDMTAQLAGLTDPLSRAAMQAKIAAQKSALLVLQADLQNSLGRLSIQFPDTLAALKSTDKDLTLQAGDRLYIPETPSYVLVLGAVYNQSAQAYTPGETVADALARSGGVTPSGDASKVYVVRANGLVESSTERQILFVNTLGQEALGPGDAVVVPTRDPNSVDAWAVFKDSLNVLGNLVGITANSMAILRTLGVI
ncbi:MAG: hypothetical protein HKM05_07160 [Spirochaetales bacterium]|nr:hypothetical protein [Spirochaetales bacterium]